MLLYFQLKNREMTMKKAEWYKKYRVFLIDGKELPETYRGNPTNQLVDMLALIGTRNNLEGNSKDKISAMGHLSREYRLAPVDQV